jgi:RNA polymerase sigma-70 factor (ECF subfamily)
MWRALPKLDVRTLPSLLAWAHTVARSAYLDAARSRTEPVTAETEHLAAVGPDPAEAALAQLNGKAALAAVARLPEHYREVVVLRFLQGLAYREVGAVLDIPPGTVRSRLAKALELLRADLREEGRNDL